MKYRIQIITFKNGRQAFYPQVKRLFVWVGLTFDGEAIFFYDSECSTRESALARIDKHFEGNTTKQTIHFEYIDK